MFPLLGPLISGASSLLSGFLNSSTSASNTQDQIAAQQQMLGQTEQFNAQQTQQQEAFQAQQVANQENYETNMSSTAYQRASQDMKAAGLNPMMMFGSGSAASTPSASAPSGASASVGTPSVPVSQAQNPFGDIGKAVSAAMSTAVQGKQIDEMSSRIANLNVDNDVLRQQARLVGNKADAAGYDVTGSQAAAEKALRYINMPSWLKNAVEYTQYGAGGVSSAADAIGSAVSSASGVGRLAQAMSGSGSKSYQYGGPSFRQWMKDNNMLGGRRPGDAGSFDGE